MRKLIYSMTVSLDGFIAGPDGAIDWSVPDEELFLFHTQQVQEIGVHLCGRRLYETMVYWETAEESPLAAEHVKFAQIWKALPKEGAAEGPAGMVVSTSPLIVKTGWGLISVGSVQLEGEEEMDAVAFVAAHSLSNKLLGGTL